MAKSVYAVDLKSTSSDCGFESRWRHFWKPPEMAVFLYFPTVFKLSYFTLIHSKSRHFSIKRGQNVGTESKVHVLSHVCFDLSVFLWSADGQKPDGIVLALHVALAKALMSPAASSFLAILPMRL